MIDFTACDRSYDLGPVYTWRTLTGVKLNNNRTQYSSPEFFGSVTKSLILNYTKRKVFKLCLFCEKLQFIFFCSAYERKIKQIVISQKVDII